jgi:putative tryptophan/tyrosine transport system substrate-binding protein
MKRRDFVAALASVVSGLPFAAFAQQIGRPVVGFFYPGPKLAAPSRIKAFLAGLRSGGFSEPQKVTLDAKITDGDASRMGPMANDLAVQKVDLILAVSSVAVLAAKKATNTIPIVAIDLESDPVSNGLINSSARPGGNITGVFLDFPDFGKKWLEMLREAIPRLSSIAVLWDPGTAPTQLNAVKAAASSLNLRLELFEVRSRGDLQAAFPSATQRAVDGVVVLSSPLIGANTNLLAELALTQKLPAVTLFTDFARQGGLMAYGPNLLAHYRQAGVMAARILGGAKPAELPIEAPTRFEFVLNLKTADALGLVMPPSILLRADEVIE